MSIFNDGLKKTLVGWFSLVVLLAVVSMGVIVFYSASEALDGAALTHLDSVKIGRADYVVDVLRGDMKALETLAASSDVMDAYELLKEYHDNGGAQEDGTFDVTSNAYMEIVAIIDPYFGNFVKDLGYHDLMFICKDHGHIMYSVLKESDLGQNLGEGELKDTNLAKLWSYVVSTGKATIVDFSSYGPSGDQVGLFIGAPVFSASGELEAVLALQLDVVQINSIMNNSTGMGDTGESYLVGTDRLMRSDSRFAKDSTILKQKVDSVAVDAAFAGESGTDVITDYRGIQVLSSYAPMNLNQKLGADFDWAIIAEQDTSEAFAAVRDMLILTLIAGGVVLIVSIGIGLVAANGIVRPLIRLKTTANKVAEGDLSIEIEASRRNDEIGDLSRSFGMMVASLRKQTQQIATNLASLASSITQLSATSTQLGSSTTETATSVSEVATTMEELRQTTQIANEKAQSVSEESERTVQVYGMKWNTWPKA